MYQQIIKEKASELDGVVEKFKVEAGKIRTGRANASMVESLMVSSYGSKVPLIQLASINVPEPRQLLIQPWNRDDLVNIEAAIRESDLGFNPNNDGQAIRITIPALNEERRKEMVKSLHKKTEEFKVSVRNVREEIWKKIQDMEKAGEMSEDDKFAGKDALQKVVDEYNQKIDVLRDAKEKEIMTV